MKKKILTYIFALFPPIFLWWCYLGLLLLPDMKIIFESESDIISRLFFHVFFALLFWPIITCWLKKIGVVSFFMIIFLFCMICLLPPGAMYGWSERASWPGMEVEQVTKGMLVFTILITVFSLALTIVYAAAKHLTNLYKSRKKLQN